MKLRGLLLLCIFVLPVAADEGIWLFNQFPKATVKEKREFDVTDPFLDHLRLSTMQLGAGSAAFVSPQGLVLTAHRVVADCVAKAGSAQHDYLKDGFYAATHADEIRCPGLDARVLVAIEDVTKQVKDAAPEAPKSLKQSVNDKAAADTLQKRNAAVARIEKACVDKTGNTCTVVRLFSGERYDLYQYKKYSDLRLVFTPERAITFFGGNPSNLTFQRYGLDVAFLRAYENGKPAATPQFLNWSEDAVKDGDLVFATGSPIATSRLSTAAQLNFYRDSSLSIQLARLRTRIRDLRDFASKSAGNLKMAELPLSTLGNEYKLTAGKLIGLNDSFMMARKANFEKKLRQSVEHDPKLGVEGGKVWDEVAAAYKTWTPFERPYQVLEQPAALGSNLFRIARQIVRGTETTPQLDVPIDDAVESNLLWRYLEELKTLGDKESPLKAILGNKTPQAAAEEFIKTTRLKDPAERKRLAADHAAVAQSTDSMIKLARLLEEPARKLQRKHADTIEALEASAAERIAQYRYKVFGAADYPDATGTPRVTYGVVKGYKDRTEAPVPYTTTFGGLFFLAANNQEIYNLPPRWLDGKPKLDLVGPFNFVSTCDITAGPAGAPIVNTKGEIVGVTFDGNLESIQLTYLYSDEAARAVHAAAPGILEALQRLYNTPGLLKELRGARLSADR
jgi:Peptidase S46